MNRTGLTTITWGGFHSLWSTVGKNPEGLIAHFKESEGESSKTSPKQERRSRSLVAVSKADPFLESLISRIQFPDILQNGRVNVEKALRVIHQVRSVQDDCRKLQWSDPNSARQATDLMALLEKKAIQFHQETQDAFPSALEVRVKEIANAIFDPFIQTASNPQAMEAARIFKNQFSNEFLKTLEERVSALAFDLLKAAILGEDSSKSFDEDLLMGGDPHKDKNTPDHNAELKLKQQWEALRTKVIVPFDTMITSFIESQAPLNSINWTDRYNIITGKIKQFQEDLASITDADLMKVLKRKEVTSSLRVETASTGKTAEDLNITRLSVYDEVNTPLFPTTRVLTPKGQISYANFVATFSAQTLKELAKTPRKFPELFFPPASELTKENTLRALLEERESFVKSIGMVCRGETKLSLGAEDLGVSISPTVTLNDEEKAYAKKLLLKLDTDLVTRVRQTFHAKEESIRAEEKSAFETRFSDKGDKKLVDKLQAAVSKTQHDRFDKFAHLRTIEDLKAAIEYSKGFNRILTDLYTQASLTDILNEAFLRNWTSQINDWRMNQ